MPTHAKNADLSAQKDAFVAWLVSAHKEPRTQTELAGVLGVDIATLSDWKHDDYVIAGLKRAESRREAGWAKAFANLERIATQTQDNTAAVSAIREMGKLLGKYPSEKVDVSVTDRAAYVPVTALADLSTKLYPN